MAGKSPSEDTSALLPEVITCVECGGRCHLLTRYEAGMTPRPGDIVAYRCEDCLDRWDVVIPEMDVPAEERDPPADRD